MFLRSEGQISPITCTASERVISRYKDDAERLAINRVFKINSTYKDSVEVDAVFRSEYLKALIAVYNATNIPERDTVVNIYNIQRVIEELHSFTINVDSTLIWVQNLLNNISPTGNSQFDYLATKYKLRKISSMGSFWYANYEIISLTSDSSWNLRALAGLFNQVNISADNGQMPFYSIFDLYPQNIEDSIGPGYMKLYYTYGWGDCPSGCEFYRRYVFKVYPDCSVEFAGAFNPLLYIGMKENIKPDNSISVSPNPFSEKIYIQSGTEVKKITLKNILGQCVLEEIGSAKEKEWGWLSQGAYFLTVENENVRKTVKLIKE
jgi:hypothetical protein